MKSKVFLFLINFLNKSENWGLKVIAQSGKSIRSSIQLQLCCQISGRLGLFAFVLAELSSSFDFSKLEELPEL